MDGYAPSYEIARVYAGLVERDAAVRWLERAWKQRSHSMVFLAVDPQLQTLRGHAGYERLVVHMGLAAGIERL